MPSPQLGGIGPGASYEDLLNYVIKLERKLDFVLQTLDSENVYEIGGWRVTPDQLASKDNDVGMSTTDTVGDDIRFWAGDAKTGSPKFKVTKSGILTAVDGNFDGAITADSGTIGGWVIAADSLKDAAGVVGMLSTVTGGNDIRFFAGDATPANAEFRVYEDGTMYATNGNFTGTITGGTLQTATSGQRIVITNNSLKTYNGTSLSGFAWGTDVSGSTFGDAFLYSGGSKAVEFYDFVGMFAIRGATGATGIRFGGNSVTAFADGNWQFEAGQTATFLGTVVLPSSTSIGSVDSTEISYLNGVTSNIQTQLNGKAASFSGYTGSVTVITSVNFGTSTTTSSTLNFSNGVLTSVT